MNTHYTLVLSINTSAAKSKTLDEHEGLHKNSSAMENTTSSWRYSLRRATAGDAPAIRQIISAVNNNPLGLDWQRFVIATDDQGRLVGCGQVKTHRDGSLELASIAVQPEWRGRGIARAIIEHLLQGYPGRLYLTCRSELGPLYRKFGFEPVQLAELPPYFKRIRRIVTVFNKLSHREDRLLVMRRN
jgi:N-acetylglutamate synthase-like GNAT family acetyltransferase